MDTPTARAIDGGMNAPLTAKQIRILAISARLAFDCHRKFGLVGETERFDDWRHRQAFAAVGVSSLRAMRARHFRPALALFVGMQGRHMAAMRNTGLGATESQRQARAVLERECATAASWFGGEEGARRYVAGFLAHKRKAALESASDRDIWHGVFVLRRRVSQLRAAGMVPVNPETHLTLRRMEP